MPVTNTYDVDPADIDPRDELPGWCPMPECTVPTPVDGVLCEAHA